MPGCWQVEVIHGQERNLLTTRLDGPEQPPLLARDQAGDAVRALVHRVQSLGWPWPAGDR